MSDTKIFGLEIYEIRKFVSLEHGTKALTLTIINSIPFQSMDVSLPPDEAERLAQDLIRRVNIIRGTKNEG